MERESTPFHGLLSDDSLEKSLTSFSKKSPFLLVSNVRVERWWDL
jgi:hypothetical protein